MHAACTIHVRASPASRAAGLRISHARGALKLPPRLSCIVRARGGWQGCDGKTGVAMVRHVALLYSVVLGPGRRVRMDDLRAMAEGLGFERVRSLVATGNLVFDAP